MARQYQTPADRYATDPEYHHLVDTMESLIVQARFTPSELREASILAAIRYETRLGIRARLSPRVLEALDTLDREFVTRKS